MHYPNITTQQQHLSMAYMNVPPSPNATTTTNNNKTIVLLHGKNFCGPQGGQQVTTDKDEVRSMINCFSGNLDLCLFA
ncbi:hypothetical protein BK809_0002730 [Diplodia seriata]|uniref:Uncharacterized protein n=1 Tax=Diplodia seriata TaxID=420778 RepID=A0A1S8B2Y2_9PEZI|nr:hypothetical protein BK809_0002730 [Diplodia seriata]